MVRIYVQSDCFLRVGCRVGCDEGCLVGYGLK